MQRIDGYTRVLSSGAPAPLATVTVYGTGTLIAATIYSDDGVTPQANPFTADSDGYFFFYAANGNYDIRISGTGITTPYSRGNVQCFDPGDAITTGGDLTVGDDLIVTDDASVGGDLAVTGASTVGGAQTVTGSQTVGGAHAVTGNQTVGGTQVVTGTSDLVGGIVTAILTLLRIRAASGSDASPTYSFTSSTGTGMLWDAGSSFLSWAIGGVRYLWLSASALVLKGDFRPSATGTYNLGAASLRWLQGFINILDLNGPTIQSGAGTPEGVITAPQGSVYLRTNGGLTDSIYIKTSGSGNTGWTAK